MKPRPPGAGARAGAGAGSEKPRPLGLFRPLNKIVTIASPDLHKRHLKVSSERVRSVASWALARRRLGGPRSTRERKKLMRRGRDALGRAGRRAAWLRVTAAASSATLLGTLGLAGTSMAATGAA